MNCPIMILTKVLKSAVAMVTFALKMSIYLQMEMSSE